MENKKFDVLIAPTDVLEEELREVLGGGTDCNGQCIEQCIVFSSEGSGDCPPGYVLVNGDCVKAN